MILLALPNLFAIHAFFAGTTRGIVIGSLFWLPLVLFFPAYIRLGQAAAFRRSLAAGVLVAVPALTALALLALPPAYLGLSDRLLWNLWAAQLAAFGAGLIGGLIKHDAAALKANLRARYLIEPGRIVVRRTPAAISGYRKETGLVLFDWVARLVYGSFAAVVLVGMVLGGGAPLILLRLLAPHIDAGAALGLHASAVLGLGMIALPGIGYLMPGLWRSWRGIKAIERDAEDEASRLIYVWPD